jgi:hypothetical protein
LVITGMPTWPYSRARGWAPTGVLAPVTAIVFAAILLGVV